MIDGGGISLRGDMTEMKYSLRILTFEYNISRFQRNLNVSTQIARKQKEQCN